MENVSKTRETKEDRNKKKKQFCENCRLHKANCLNGKFLLKVSERTRGMHFKTTGLFWDDINLGLVCVVEGGDTFSAEIRWVSSDGNKTGAVETYPLKYKQSHLFKFYCDMDESSPEKEIINSNVSIDKKPSTSHFVHRLPLRRTEKECLIHKPNGEKHRLKFCASEDITLTGIGFLVAKNIDRVTITVSYRLEDRPDYNPITTGEDFWNVGSRDSTVILRLRKPLPLTCDKIYLLSVTLHGGASIVGHGGEEFISVASWDKGNVLFKFENYIKKSKAAEQGMTNVEKGVIEKIYFSI